MNESIAEEKITTPFNRDLSLGARIRTDKNLDVLFAMTDKAHHACGSASGAIQNITFRYVASLAAVLLALNSKSILITGTYGKMAAVIGVVLFALVATVDLLMKQKQYMSLLKVLVHLEDLLGCYTPGCHVENATLLPPEWREIDNKYVGQKVNRIRLVILWGLGAVVCFVIFLSGNSAPNVP